MSAFLRPIALAVAIPALTLALILATASSEAQAQSGETRCLKVCAQLIQAIGDDIKEQIPLDCVQATATCTGSGFFQANEARIPVTVEGGLTDANTLTLRVTSGQSKFVPTDADALVMTLEPGTAYQSGRFVVAQRTGDAPFAQAGTALTVTVIVERLM